jgi:hypothetical protein
LVITLAREIASSSHGHDLVRGIRLFSWVGAACRCTGRSTPKCACSLGVAKARSPSPMRGTVGCTSRRERPVVPEAVRRPRGTVFHDWRRAACAVCQNPGLSRARACRCPCNSLHPRTDRRVCPPAGRTSFRRPAHQDVSRSETGAYLVGQPEKIKPGGRCHALILQRLKERALELPHLAIAVTTNGRSHRKLAHSGSVGARAGPPFLRQGP